MEQILKNEKSGILWSAAGLTAAVVLPWLAHLAGISGIRFLPMYTAPLLCGLLFSTRYALPVALLAPVMSHLITGMPVPAVAALLTLELIAAVTVLRLTANRHPLLRGTAALAAGRLSSLVPALLLPGLSAAGWVTNIRIGIPGLLLHLVLFALFGFFHQREQ